MRRAAGLITAAAVVGGLLVPGAAFGVDTGGELADTRARLSEAQRDMHELGTAVRRANDEVAALDIRLTAATTTLEEVTGQLARARTRADDAALAERRAADALADADRALSDSLADWNANRTQLADRAVHAYKHGATTTHDVLVRGVVGAHDFHDVAITIETVGRLTDRDRDLLERQVTSARAAAAEHTDVAALRAVSVAAARTAAAEASRVAALVERQERTVAEVSAAREERATVLRRLEADAAARAVLVRELEDRVAALELSAARVLIPVDVDLDPFGAPPAWAAGLPAAGPTWAAAIDATAARHGLDGRLLAALVWTESNFRPDAVSHAGALGLAQLMPGTARGLGVDPRDPLANLDGGARYLRAQLDRFGRVDLALAAYNAGPGRVERAGAVPDIVETQLYVVRVLDRYARIGG